MSLSWLLVSFTNFFLFEDSESELLLFSSALLLVRSSLLSFSLNRTSLWSRRLDRLKLDVANIEAKTKIIMGNKLNLILRIVRECACSSSDEIIKERK